MIAIHFLPRIGCGISALGSSRQTTLQRGKYCRSGNFRCKKYFCGLHKQKKIFYNEQSLLSRVSTVCGYSTTCVNIVLKLLTTALFLLAVCLKKPKLQSVQTNYNSWGSTTCHCRAYLLFSLVTVMSLAYTFQLRGSNDFDDNVEAIAHTSIPV